MLCPVGGVTYSVENAAETHPSQSALFKEVADAGIELGGDAQAHDPAPLGNATVADESELFEQALWPGVQVGATLRVTSSNLLGVGLDQASASMRYRGQHRGNSGPRHAFAAGSGTGEQAADPPVRWKQDPQPRT